jgi:NACHT conflict system protein/NACHT domain-containing protein
METASFGLRLASSAIAPLIKRLFRQDGRGAGLVDKPVRISALVTFGGEKRTLSTKGMHKLTGELVARAVRAVGPHDAPTPVQQREVADALATSLARLDTLSMNDVQAVRLGPQGLVERIEYPADLSAAADALYQPLLHTTCVHILNFFTQRSTFVARTLVEQSQQLDHLIRRIDQLAERLPPQSLADTTFEGRYARYVVTRHSHLTIYGIDLNAAREWPLDAAYLTLQATEREPSLPDRPGDIPAPPQPAERALAGRERVLLRGEAGSGKTTLVQWLAVTTARQESVGGDMTHLLGRVPFVLPMRTLTRGGRELPAPDAFLAAVSCPIAGAQPDGWTDRVLGAGRGVLLIDGIDEIPEPEREAARRWLHELVAAYPGNLWLVTARPSAVREDWLAADDFAELSLTRMSQDDIAAFVHRWHEAAGAESSYEEALLDAIRTKPDLGRLATNPLMCGLICALHRERRGYLPRGRKALYDAALLMLLERRDRERGLNAGAIELDAETQTLLLQKLAYWLIRNGHSEMDRTVALDLVTRVLPSMQTVAEQGPPEAVFRHLLERSGLLREPAPGAVDFVHRTFQDYLGAREAVEERDFPLLVDNAHSDQWQDVIRMAVAHARPDERARLLTDLLERGDRVPVGRRRIRLHLLALACLEHATQLDLAVRKAVERRAAAVVPPRTPREARALAAVGPVVLEVLPGPDGLSDEEADAVVQTASLIGTDAAVLRLARFVDHPSARVRRRLAAYWTDVDPARYADEVLSRLTLTDDFPLTAHTPEHLGMLRELPDHDFVLLRGDLTGDDISNSLASKPIRSLLFWDGKWIKDLEFLSAFPLLGTLHLEDMSHVTDLSPLTGLPLSDLTLYDLPQLRDMSCLDALPQLRELSISNVMFCSDLSGLPSTAPLTRLGLPEEAHDLTGIGSWPTLRRLDAQRLESGPTPASWGAIAELPELTELSVNPTVLASLAEHRRPLPRVTTLLVVTLHGDADLSHVPEYFPAVRELSLSAPDDSTTDLAPLAALDDLRTVTIHGEPHTNADQLPPHITVTAPPTSRYWV